MIVQNFVQELFYMEKFYKIYKNIKNLIILLQMFYFAFQPYFPSCKTSDVFTSTDI